MLQLLLNENTVYNETTFMYFHVTYSPELPQTLQTASVVGSNLYEAVRVVWPYICQIDSFMLGESRRE